MSGLLRVLSLLAFPAVVIANPGRLDPTFVPTPAPNGVIHALLAHPDGSIIVGGEFTQIGSAPQAYLAKYRADGTHDPTFTPTLDGPVLALEPYFGFPWYAFWAGGTFETVNSVQSEGLVGLELDGTLDSHSPFTVGTGFDGPVRAIKYNLSSDLLVGGDFDTFQSTPVGNLVGIREGASPGALPQLVRDYRVDGPVNAITDGFSSDHNYIGGLFTRVSGLAASNCAAIDRSGAYSGSLWPVVNGEITDLQMVVQSPPAYPRQSILALGGSFTRINNRPSPGLGAMLIDRGQPVIVSFASAGASDASALRADSEQNLVVASAAGDLWRFTSITAGLPTREWNADATFLPSPHTNNRIEAIAPGPLKRYYIGGAFSEVDGTTRPYFARLYGPQGSAPPAAPAVGESTATDDRALADFTEVPYALGYQAEYSGDGGQTWHLQPESVEPAAFLLGLRPEQSYEVRARARNTNGWGPFGPSAAFMTTAPRPDAGPNAYLPLPSDWIRSSIQDVFLDSSGRLVLVDFNDIEGELKGGLVVLDDQLEVAFCFNSTNNPRLQEARPDPRGGIVAEYSSGNFVRLDPTGAIDPEFNPQFDPSHYLRDFVVQSDGKIVLAGLFSGIQDAPNTTLVRLNANGSVDATYNPVFTRNANPGQALHLELLPGDGLLVCGEFDAVDGNPAGQVVKLTSSGAVDPSFTLLPDTSNFWIFNDAAVDSQGRVLLAGLFQNGPSGDRVGIARLTTAGTVDPGFAEVVARSGFSTRQVDLIKLQSDGKILGAAGFSSFDSVSDVRAFSLFRLTPDGTVDPTFDAGLGLRHDSGGDGILEAIEVLPDSTIVLVGQFDRSDGEPRESLAFLRSDGTPSDYDLWLTSYGLPAGSDPRIDDDGDHFELGIEFGYRMDPTTRDAATVLETHQTGARIVPPLQRGVHVEGRFSENLEDWLTVPITPDWCLAPPQGTGSDHGHFRFELTPAE